MCSDVSLAYNYILQSLPGQISFVLLANVINSRELMQSPLSRLFEIHGPSFLVALVGELDNPQTKLGMLAGHLQRCLA